MWFLKQYPPKQLVWDEGNKCEQNGFKGILIYHLFLFMSLVGKNGMAKSEY